MNKTFGLEIYRLYRPTCTHLHPKIFNAWINFIYSVYLIVEASRLMKNKILGKYESMADRNSHYPVDYSFKRLSVTREHDRFLKTRSVRKETLFPFFERRRKYKYIEIFDSTSNDEELIASIESRHRWTNAVTSWSIFRTLGWWMVVKETTAVSLE